MQVKAWQVNCDIPRLQIQFKENNYLSNWIIFFATRLSLGRHRSQTESAQRQLNQLFDLITLKLINS